MDFLRLRGGCAVSLAPKRTRIAEAVSLLGLSLGSRTFRGRRAGVDYKYLDPAAGAVVYRAAFDIGGTAVL
jgi:hypothetical protein